jgi:hypothetical protein
LTPELPFTRFWPFRIQASGTAAAPTGPWLSAVYHVRACNRYYGLIRQSDELRPVWLYQLTLAGLCPGRAVRLTFPSLFCHIAHAMCCDRHVLRLPEEKIAQGLLSRGIDSQPLREVFLDRPVAFLHFVEGRFQVLPLSPRR